MARYYRIWVAKKLKEFDKLKLQIVDKINKKDQSEKYIQKLEEELDKTGQIANKYFSNFLQLDKA